MSHPSIGQAPHRSQALLSLASFAFTKLNGIPVRTEEQFIRQAQADEADPVAVLRARRYLSPS